MYCIRGCGHVYGDVAIRPRVLDYEMDKNSKKLKISGNVVECTVHLTLDIRRFVIPQTRKFVSWTYAPVFVICR